MSELTNRLKANRFFQTFGLDGSAYQVPLKDGRREAPIDWSQAAKHDIDFVVWRSVVGDYYQDPTFIPNMIGAREVAGIQNRGAYIVVRADKSAAGHLALFEQQLDGLAKLEGIGFRMPLPIVDVEVYQSKKWDKKKNKWVVDRTFSKTEINQRTKQVITGLEKMTRKKPVFYSYPAFVFEHMGGSIPGGAPAWLKDYQLWLAGYLNEFEDVVDLEKIPDGVLYYLKHLPWYEENPPLFGCAIWQFSSEVDNNKMGSEFGGYADDFDLNRSHLTKREINYLFRFGKLPPPIPPFWAAVIERLRGLGKL